MGTGSTVTNGSVSSLDKVTGLSVNDGRTENKVSTDAEGNNPQDNNKYDGKRPQKTIQRILQKKYRRIPSYSVPM